MPIYEYECAKCHKTTEAIQKFSDSASYRVSPMWWLFQNSFLGLVFQLKGTGWYATTIKNPLAAPRQSKAAQRVRPPTREARRGHLQTDPAINSL